MRIRLKAAIFLIGLLGFGSTAAWGAGDGGGRNREATVATGISSHRASAILHQAEAVVEDPSGRELTQVLARLAAAAPRLSGAELARANALLARPTDRRKDPDQNGYRVRQAAPLCSAHFCVHYVSATADAPSLTDADGSGRPDYVELVTELAEASYAEEVVRLGWRRPRSDRGLGGSNATDIYLSQIGNEGLYGYASTDPNQGRRGNPFPLSQHTYMVIDDDFSRREFRAPPAGSAAVTIAHEFNHVLQFGYDIRQDEWFGESVATWMENRVFPKVDDYLSYMPGWANLPFLPLTQAQFPKEYGSAVWNQWLEARYGPGVIRRAWELATQVRLDGFGVGAYNEAIRRAGRSAFSRAFARFAIDTAEWRVNGRFLEGRRFPRVRRAGTLSRRFKERLIDHTGFTLYRVKVPRGNPASIRLGAFVGRDTKAAIALIGLKKKGSRPRVVKRMRFLRRGGRRSVSLGRPGRFSRITAALVNADARQNGYGTSDWNYTKDRVLFKARVLVRR